MNQKPEDLLPIGTVVKIGEAAIRAKILDYTYDEHALGGWGYLMQWYDDPKAAPFSWPHGCNYSGWTAIKLPHPLELLGMQAE